MVLHMKVQYYYSFLEVQIEILVVLTEHLFFIELDSLSIFSK